MEITVRNLEESKIKDVILDLPYHEDEITIAN